MVSTGTFHRGTAEWLLRRRLVAVAAVTALLATVHFADHVIRGQLVVDRGLNPAWNHSGWPFQPQLTPFTISFGLVYALLLGGIVLTLRGRVWAGYWLATSIVLAALVTQVHFVPGPNQESPAVIIGTYGNWALGLSAVVVTLGIVLALAVMAAQAVRVRRVSRRW